MGTRNNYAGLTGRRAKLVLTALVSLCCEHAASAQSTPSSVFPVEKVLRQVKKFPVNDSLRFSTVYVQPMPVTKRKRGANITLPDQDEGWLMAEVGQATGKTTFTIRWSRQSTQQLSEASAARFKLPNYPEQAAPKPSATYMRSCEDGHSETDAFIPLVTVYGRACVNSLSQSIPVTREVVEFLANRLNVDPDGAMTVEAISEDKAFLPVKLRFFPVEAKALLMAIDQERTKSAEKSSHSRTPRG
jgi:hypothetical protein